jgi:hypothetical protein
MTDKPLHPELETLCDKLNSIAQTILNSNSDNRTLLEMYGWNCPAVNRHGLSRVASDLADMIRSHGSETLDESILKIVKEAQSNVERLKGTTLQQFWSGNGGIASSVYITTISCLRSDLEPILGWQSIRDTNLIPAKMARRIRNYQAALDEIAPNKDELTRRINLINEATESAESLPTDLAALTAARNKIDLLQTESIGMHGKIAGRLNESNLDRDKIKIFEGEASKLVNQCEEAYRITTTKGLAAAFDQRARSLAGSMWVWVVGLIAALGIGYFMGSSRLKDLTDLLNSADKQHESVWPTAILALISLGAPLWLAWIATKQIGQRFRLAEDYAFKASVAKAYEGYRKEAAKIDKAFEARLFASALTRLEEAPLRLVEEKTHGSPWHEFVESSGFQQALKLIPGLREKFNRTQERMGESIVKDGDGNVSESANSPK